MIKPPESAYIYLKQEGWTAYTEGLSKTEAIWVF